MYKFLVIGFISNLLIISNLFAQQVVEHPFNNDTRDAILFLETVRQEDLPFIRFFTTSCIKPEKREKAVLALSFVLHSLTGLGNDATGNAGGYYPLAKMEEVEDPITGLKQQIFVPYNQVLNSETLWWIDIRNYNWTISAWEKISATDGYLVEPIIDHKTNSLLRLISGNAIVRADWFCAHATDTTMQSDKDIPVDFYRTLIYANSEKIPTTVAELNSYWGFDPDELHNLGTESATITTSSEQVARHNRILFHYRTPFGYRYETYDVKHQLGQRDYVATFPEMGGNRPNISDAGELFFSNPLQMQVYDLRDGQGNLVDFADPTVARHIQDTIGDTRVRTAHSCMDCHAAGPLPAQNTIERYLRSANLYIPNKEDQLRIDRVYLSRRFEDSVTDSQELYARALLKVNGLKPEENAQNYLDVVDDYKKPVDIETAAFECGMELGDFRLELSKEDATLGRRIPGRLAILLSIGDPIPREVWESPGRDGIPGMFQQTMIYINGLTVIETTHEIVTEEVQVIEEPVVEQPAPAPILPVGQKVYVVTRNVTLDDKVIERGTELSTPDYTKLSNRDEILKYEEENEVVTLIYENKLVYIPVGNVREK